MRSVLVTGGAGFMGSHLVDKLLEGGAAVRVLDNLSTGSLRNLQAAAERHSRGLGAPSGTRLEVIIGDVRDREVLRKALRTVKYVFHLAALPASGASRRDPNEIHAVNVEGTLNVLHGALTEGVWRVVVASCASVYGPTPGGMLREDAPLRPSSLFAASKAAAEVGCWLFHPRHQLDTVTLRFFNVYGPRQKPASSGSLVCELIDAIRHQRPVADEDNRSADDFLYVEDAIAATLAAARAPRATGRVINVGSGQMVTIAEALRILADLLRITEIPDLPVDLGGHSRRAWAETALAVELLNFTPRVSLIAGLARVIRSLAENEQAERAFALTALDD